MLRVLARSFLQPLGCVVALSLLAGTAAGAGEAGVAPPAEVGLWQTISDKTGKPEGYIRISLVGAELRGVIERGMPGDDPNELCTKCPGDRKNQKKLGMTILTGMHRQDDHWGGGEILDPDNGSTYRCRIKAVDSGRKLEVRGYIGFSLLGRTQTWVRAE
ncbi:MAG: DUF2147 domain-containing protein [Burkholderiaceae bacterium]|nr:DUF2147 domain-containing protein [Burkholderiaceae bacterium]